MELMDVVARFATQTFAIQDRDLERAWTWGEYDEGVRFAFFRTYEQLRDLAAGIAALRRDAGIPQTLAQHLLAQYHAAALDLQAVLLGVDDRIAVQEPASGEWPLRQVLLHMVKTDRSFYTVCNYALDRVRNRDDRPLEITDEAWDAFWAGDPFDRLQSIGSFSEIMAYYTGLHRRILDTFVDASEDELAAPSVFWETTPMSVRFRMHRFDSHLRQHTIQMEKTRAMLALPHPEVLRLWRLIYAALAEVEGISLGSGGIGYEDCEAVAEEISARRIEIVKILQGEFHARPPD